MSNQKKPVETSTVLIAIAFLAIFIIMPPLARVLYPAEEENFNNPDSGDVSDVSNATMTCSRTYQNFGPTITSTSTYDETGAIISNQLIISNAVAIEAITATTDEDQADLQEYSEVLALIQANNTDGAPGEYTLTIDSNILGATTDATIQDHFQERVLLQSYYEEKGYTCN